MADPTTPQTPVLDLDILTGATRPVVRIDGTPYPLKDPDELSVLDFHRAVPRRALELEELANPTDSEAQEYSAILDQGCRLVLEAPDEVHQRLKNRQREQVISVFTRLWLGGFRSKTRVEDPAAAAGAVTPPPIGAN